VFTATASCGLTYDLNTAFDADGHITVKIPQDAGTWHEYWNVIEWHPLQDEDHPLRQAACCELVHFESPFRCRFEPLPRLCRPPASSHWPFGRGDQITGGLNVFSRLENSVPTIGTCPYLLPTFVGRPSSRDVLRPSQPSDGPALTGHCGPELLDGPRRSVVRLLTCNGSSKLANMLFQVCPAPR
jgi:hypothetical protein